MDERVVDEMDAVYEGGMNPAVSGRKTSHSLGMPALLSAFSSIPEEEERGKMALSSAEYLEETVILFISSDPAIVDESPPVIL